jgi:hypothetical protein
MSPYTLVSMTPAPIGPLIERRICTICVGLVVGHVFLTQAAVGPSDLKRVLPMHFDDLRGIDVPLLPLYFSAVVL